jgi:hypothetical protein
MHGGRLKATGDFMENPFMRNPGPDAYQKIEWKSGQGRSMPKARTSEKFNDNPGPGAYDVGHDSLVKRSYHAEFWMNQ